ncbi:MAG: hypothetical protein FJ405_12180 [Verrucomicrobia bacterium]|nr:hypothetical protein [Verrucomicrobiota bacterium]
MSGLDPCHPPVVQRILRYIQDVTHAGFSDDASFGSRFNELSLELFEFQLAHSEPYRAWCGALGRDRLRPGNWFEIPCVPTISFKEVDWSCLPADQRRHVFHSSGTTTHHPSRHFHSDGSLQLYESSLLPWFERHLMAGLYPNQLVRLLSLTPPPAIATRSSLAWMMGSVLRTYGSSGAIFAGRLDSTGAWEVDGDLVTRHLCAPGTTEEPTILLGTAFNFVHLIDEFSRRGIRLQLPPGSAVMETGGYKGRSRSMPRDELHAMITERLGLGGDRIICEYGMSELSSQAYDLALSNPSALAPSSRRFRFPPWARVRIISPETGDEVGMGQAGVVQVVDLANAYSAMALRTGDLGRRWEDGFELIGRAEPSDPRGCSLASPSLS